MNASFEEKFSLFLADEHLPSNYASMLADYLVPLANWIERQKKHETFVLGINGAQGSGKSTLSKVLAWLLSEKLGYHVVIISLDDLYLTKQERVQLAGKVHPLFQTRGVPGTHDVDLGIHLLKQLKQGHFNIGLPRFDKANDDRAAKDDWVQIQSPVDIVLFEGWCIATPAQLERELMIPINALEARDDSQGIWRKVVNDALAYRYQPLFSTIDALLFLQAPNFEAVFSWRKKQELATFFESPEQGMDDIQLTQFIQHFERLTRQALNHLPQVADVVLPLNDQQEIINIVFKAMR